MDVSPQLIREIEFREQWRGYSPDEVDDFLERLAVAVEALQERLRQLADGRSATGGDGAVAGEDELRRTLVLAQRTADAAIAEAQAEAGRIVVEAEERARRLLAEAEDQAAEALGELSERRAALEADVDVLTSYVEQHRGRLRDDLREQLEWLEESGRLQLPPPPSLSSRAVPAPDLDDQEPTGLYDTLGGDDEDGGGDLPSAEPSYQDPSAAEAASAEAPSNGNGAPAETAGNQGQHDDDPFLAELRRAVDDPKPLGPRHQPAGDIDLTQSDDTGELTPSSRIRRRRRR